MNALLVYPSYPDTFMGYKHALKFIRKKAVFPPMGLLTVAAMLPAEWSKRVVDLNVESLTSADLEWADLVLISAMIIQKKSALEVVSSCREKGVTIVAGGPLFTHLYREIEGVDHFVLGEAEGILPTFLDDLRRGRAKPIYQAEEHPDLANTPVPSWELINFRHYRTMPVQFSRGCPFDCEFCDIVHLFGRRPRFKKTGQVIAELDRMYQLGWRGGVMVVDDNFICNKSKTKELLQEMIIWQRERSYPFNFNTQASVNLAQEPELLSLMAKANLDSVFLGIETPAIESLQECNKRQNQVDLTMAVRTIQNYGLDVQGGFIVGFDSDRPSIFDEQVSFIERATIPTAMVGLLSVVPGTRLHKRLGAQGRLLGQASGDNAMDEAALNFVPKMNREKLMDGYKSVLRRLYEPKAYYRRVLPFLRRYEQARKRNRLPGRQLAYRDVVAGIRILWQLGFRECGRRAFWTFLIRVGLFHPSRLPLALNYAATGYHFQTITKRFING